MTLSNRARRIIERILELRKELRSLCMELKDIREEEAQKHEDSWEEHLKEWDGIMAADNPQEPKPVKHGRGSIKGSVRRCKRCGEPGHFEKTCTNFSKEEYK